MGAKSILTGLVLAFGVASGVSHAAVVTGSTVQSINGYESYLDVFDQATAKLVSGADVSWLGMHEQSNLDFFAGEASWVRMYDNSHADIFGGVLSWLLMFDAGAANIYRSEISWLVLNGNSRVDIYGSNFSYSGGQLSGNWGDGTAFSFWALNGNAQGLPTGFGSSLMPENIVLHAVPAPATADLIMVALTLLVLFHGRPPMRQKPPV